MQDDKRPDATAPNIAEVIFTEYAGLLPGNKYLPTVVAKYTMIVYNGYPVVKQGVVIIKSEHDHDDGCGLEDSVASPRIMLQTQIPHLPGGCEVPNLHPSATSSPESPPAIDGESV